MKMKVRDNCEKDWISLSLVTEGEPYEDEDAHICVRFNGKTYKWYLPKWKIFGPGYIERKSTLNDNLVRDYHYREYGFSIFNDHWSIYYGAQTHDSSTTKRLGGFIPWKSWTYIRYSTYDIDNKTIIGTIWENKKPRKFDFSEQEELRNNTPKVQIKFNDYDGEEGIATCYIGEREWHKGEKWCKFLKWFTPSMIRREVDITYNIEVGKKKGSWKGGTIGTSFDIMKNETIEQAFRLHCKNNNLQYLGIIE